MNVPIAPTYETFIDWQKLQSHRNIMPKKKK